MFLRKKTSLDFPVDFIKQFVSEWWWAIPKIRVFNFVILLKLRKFDAHKIYLACSSYLDKLNEYRPNGSDALQLGSKAGMTYCTMTQHCYYF